MIRYTDSVESISPEMLRAFFDGWPRPPSTEAHLKIFRNSQFVVLAIDDSSRRVVGFINALSDGILCAYLPLLEVLPEYRGHGIGKELIRRMLATLKGFYMVDLLCDKSLQPFYASHGMSHATGMMLRNVEWQSEKEV